MKVACFAGEVLIDWTIGFGDLHTRKAIPESERQGIEVGACVHVEQHETARAGCPEQYDTVEPWEAFERDRAGKRAAGLPVCGCKRRGP